jgi:iron complex transport system substrate-binding protein
MRVVSLLPSATEICYALGVEPVGVSHECDWPPAAAEQPSVTRSRVDADATSDEINAQVADAESEGGVYDIDDERLAALDPDLVVTQGVCEVCAVETVQVTRALERVGSDAAVLTTDPHSVDDVLADVERVGDALGRRERAVEVVASLRNRIDAVDQRARRADECPAVAVFDWLDPVMVAGHWLPELVELAGGDYTMADPGDRSTPREWASVRAADPDVLVAAPCGFDLDQTVANSVDLTGREGWTALQAVERDRVYAMDGHHYVNRPGPHLVDTLEYLAGVIHPTLFETPPEDVVRPLSA